MSSSDDSESSDDETVYLENENRLTAEIIESNEDQEQSDENEFFNETFDILKHMKCVAHKLQLVLKDAFEKNTEMIALKKVNIFTFNFFFVACDENRCLFFSLQRGCNIIETANK